MVLMHQVGEVGPAEVGRGGWRVAVVTVGGKLIPDGDAEAAVAGQLCGAVAITEV